MSVAISPTTGRTLREFALVYHDFLPAQEPLREALCVVGNGYFATRGALEWSTADDETHYPGTYLAGGYNRLETEVAGRVVENEDLVNWPNWLPLTFRIEGEADWFSLDSVTLHEYTQELDMYCGLLNRTLRFTDAAGRETELRTRRFVHMDMAHHAAIEWTLIARNWSGTIEIESGIDGSVENRGVERYRALNSKHLRILASGAASEHSIYLTCETVQSHLRMCQAVRTEVFHDNDQPAAVERRTIGGGERVAQRIVCTITQSKPLHIEKVLALFTSRDFAISEPEVEARTRIERVERIPRLLERHTEAWQRLWHRSAIEIEVARQPSEAQTLLNLHIFHMLQTTSMNTIDWDAGVPARGWHGEAYRGHIFWDEIFIFPFLNLTLPELTRTLLLYRYYRLEQARYNAREAGFGGAMFPWQSGSNGREETQVLHLNPKSGRWLPDHTHRQCHVNGAIAYNVWQYYEATGDIDFLAFYGAEMLLEIARLWASIAQYDATRQRYVIRHVVGPDEFHTHYPGSDEPGLDNNTYTNVLAVWTLKIARLALDQLDEDRRQELIQKLDLTDEEFARWAEISRRMFVPFHADETGHFIPSQFEGYEALDEFDFDGYRAKHGDIQRLDRILEAEGDSPDHYKASKQADALMLFYLFGREQIEELFAHMGYELTPGTIERTVDYYSRRTSHGSTLSRVVNAWVCSCMDREHGWDWFTEALRSDIDDIQGGTTPEGIHLGAMAGTVDLMQRGYTGLEMREGVLWFNPQLPSALTRLRTRMRYHGHWLAVELTHDELAVTCERGDDRLVEIGLNGNTHRLGQGECKQLKLS